MQIALVAVVLLAGMWFTVLKPKPDSGSSAPVAATPAPVLPGVKGLATAVDKAKGAATASNAANAKVQTATGSAPAAAKPAATKVVATPKAAAAAKAKAAAAAKAKSVAAARKGGTKVAATPKATAPTKAAGPVTLVDPSDRLLAYLAKGKTLVILFYGKSADDKSARKAVHRTALADPKHVVSAYVPIGQVGHYEAITSSVDVATFPTILVIGTDRKATALTGFVDASTVEQAVGDARREAAAAAKSTK